MGDSVLTDPLGRTVVLADRTWAGHIIRGHPEISEHRVLAEQAITFSDEIWTSRFDEDCRIYFGPGPRASVRMMVVADVIVGVVKTAHLCKKVSGGSCEWSR